MLLNETVFLSYLINHKSNHSEVLLVKGVLKICSKFTGEQPCRSVISIKLLCNFIKIIPRHGCSPLNLLHIFRTPFTKNTSERLFLTSRKTLLIIQAYADLTADWNWSNRWPKLVLAGLTEKEINDFLM